MSVISNNQLAGAAGQGGSGYTIQHSLRFNSGDSSYLSRTPSSAGNRRTWTWSGWVKRSKLGTFQTVFGLRPGSSPWNQLIFRDSNVLQWDTNSSFGNFQTSQVFRDVSAWYHIVLAVDTTASTGSDRIKLYINGTQVTEFASSSTPSLNQVGSINDSVQHNIGAQGPPTYGDYFNGYVTDVHFIDGQALAPTDFGEYDDNNVWQPKEFTGSYTQTSGGTAISSASGAKPILNTSDDDGQTVSSGVRTDSNASSIVLALPLNGSNGGTTITDYHHTIKGSGSAKAVSIYTGSASGGAVTSTAVSRYYGSSFYAVRGATNNYTASDYIYRTGDTDLNLGTGDFCVEFWYYPQNMTSNSVMFDNRHESNSWPNSTNGFALIHNAGGTVWSYSGGNAIINHGNKLTANQWNHIAYTRDSGTERLFVNGDFFTTTVSSSRNYNEGRFQLGSAANNGEGTSGYYQGLRIYKGVPKYTSNFNVPVLGVGGVNSYHLNFADNSSNAALGTDSSGNNNDWTVQNLIAGSPAVSTSAITNVQAGANPQLTFADNSGLEYFQVGDVAQGLATADPGNMDGYNSLTNQATINNGFDGNPNSYCGLVAQSSYSGAVPNSDAVTITLPTAFPNVTKVEIWGDGGNNARTAGWINDYTDPLTNNITSGVKWQTIYSGAAVTLEKLRFATANSSAGMNFRQVRINSSDILLFPGASVVSVDTANNQITVNGGTWSNGAVITKDAIEGDNLIDTPTDYEATPNNGGNYATFNPLDSQSQWTLSNGNLQITKSSSSGDRGSFLTIGPTSGKFYWEVTFTSTASGMYVGLAKKGRVQIGTGIWSGGVDAYMYNGSTGNKHGQGNGGGGVSYGDTFGVNDVIGCAVDWDAGDITFYKNGVSQGSAWTGQDFSEYMPAVYGNTNQSPAAVLNTGAGSFAYTPPTGYKSLCTTNLPDPTIADGSTAMDAVVYSSTGSAQTISGLNISPDLVWIKNRSAAVSHRLYDIIRGVNKPLTPNDTSGEANETGLSAFNSDGFSISGSRQEVVGNSGDSLVAWTWNAGDTTVTNTDGSLTSQVRANPSAGFSIVTYQSNGTRGASIGHGLNTAPSWVVVKNRDNSYDWMVGHDGLGGWSNFIRLNTSGTKGSASSIFADTAPTSSVFYVGEDNTVNAGSPVQNYVAYCFAPVEGYSAFGSYTGNGSADGPFVYTGFRPRWVLLKSAGGAFAWHLFDTARDTYNLSDARLRPDSSGVEDTSNPIDIYSNGFKIRTNGNGLNQSNISVIYAAFAEHPFKTARAR